jgi:hypothetical protein
MRGNRVVLVDYSFIRTDAPILVDTYGSEWETCPTTSSTAVTDREGLDAGCNPEAQDSATLAPLRNERVSGHTTRSVVLLFPRVIELSEISWCRCRDWPHVVRL